MQEGLGVVVLRRSQQLTASPPFARTSHVRGCMAKQPTPCLSWQRNHRHKDSLTADQVANRGDRRGDPSWRNNRRARSVVLRPGRWQQKSVPFSRTRGTVGHYFACRVAQRKHRMTAPLQQTAAQLVDGQNRVRNGGCLLYGGPRSSCTERVFSLSTCCQQAPGDDLPVNPNVKSRQASFCLDRLSLCGVKPLPASSDR
ncbi:hypothetical protein VTN02DRAFT_5295 [Thermoascus thermophilus]